MVKRRRQNFERLLTKVFDAPINLYFDVTPSHEIARMVDSDFSKYDGFKNSLYGLMYPGYELFQTLILIIYFVPNVLIPLLLMSYFILRQ
jgi:hypothetical protein